MIDKPLGHKCYPSIGHLPGSRLGPADKKVNAGQARIATVKTRDAQDLVIVQEKLDGANVGVAMIGGELVALSRAGYRVATSPYEHHRLFGRWVRASADRFHAVLDEGERLVGEWLAQACGTLYDLPHEPFVAFDLMRGPARLCWRELQHRLGGRFVLPNTVYVGGALAADEALAVVGAGGHGAVDPAEGAVWRVERRGRVDFLVKFVRQDKEDGRYLPQITGEPAIWHWHDDPSVALWRPLQMSDRTPQ